MSAADRKQLRMEERTPGTAQHSSVAGNHLPVQAQLNKSRARGTSNWHIMERDDAQVTGKTGAGQESNLANYIKDGLANHMWNPVRSTGRQPPQRAELPSAFHVHHILNRSSSTLIYAC